MLIFKLTLGICDVIPACESCLRATHECILAWFIVLNSQNIHWFICIWDTPSPRVDNIFKVSSLSQNQSECCLGWNCLVLAKWITHATLLMLISSNFRGVAPTFPRDEDQFRLPPWTFRPAKHGWKYFLTLTFFPSQIRNFKNLKGIWHQMQSCPCQLQGIFGFLKPLFHVQIVDWSWSVDKNDGVQMN